MISAHNALKSLVVYGLVLPLALIMGYILAEPGSLSSVAIVGMVLLILLVPLMLKWHHPMLFFAWNMSVVMPILATQVQLWFILAFVSLLISVIQAAMVRQIRFLNAPSLFWPMVALVITVVVTMQLTGGIGIRALGSNTYGGRRYLLLLAGVVGYFAMIARPIPPEKAQLYVALFFLGTLTNLIGGFLVYAPSWLYWLAAFFPVTTNDLGTMGDELLVTPSPAEFIPRFYGLQVACTGVLCWCLGKWGIRGMLTATRPWRLGFVILISLLGAMGGFRSYAVLVGLLFVIAFVCEGLVRSKYAMPVLLICVLGGAALVATSSKLPVSIQRSISFLPVEIDPVARYQAEGSNEWRLRMWRAIVPEIPRYFWLGKGLSMDPIALNLEKAAYSRSLHTIPESGDFHNGPLTIIIPFGVWGALAWLWFLVASIRALYLNHLYGDEALKQVNTFLLAWFLAKTLFFLFAFGNFYTDVMTFAGIVGLSIALNHGIRRSTEASAVPNAIPLRKLELRPRASVGFVR